MRRTRKSSWLPPLLALMGIAFYVWDGMQMNSWRKNLPNIIVFAVIILALWWALRKKENFNNQKNQ